jgi:hypothetical protein
MVTLSLLYNFERKITTPIEYGTQLLVDRDNFKLDSWIAWQKMIYKGDAAKRRDCWRIDYRGYLAEKLDNWKLSIPARVLGLSPRGSN